MKILIIRHGESEADILHVHEGRADFDLTERGHAQAKAMSEYAAANYHIDKIYHSTLKRSVQTAEHLAAECGAPLIPDEHLMEFNNGIYAGLPYEEALLKYPPVDVPPYKAVYEQETMLEFRHRAEYMLSKMISENEPDSTIAAVTHGGMIHQLYKAFLRLPVDMGYRFYSGDACIHEWLIDGGYRVIARANFIPYNI